MQQTEGCIPLRDEEALDPLAALVPLTRPHEPHMINKRCPARNVQATAPQHRRRVAAAAGAWRSRRHCRRSRGVLWWEIRPSTENFPEPTERSDAAAAPAAGCRNGANFPRLQPGLPMHCMRRLPCGQLRSEALTHSPLPLKLQEASL